MGKLGGIALIVTGVILLLNIILMSIGGLKVMIGLTMPTILKFLPLNEMLRAWVDVPLAMGLTAYFTSIEAIHEEGYIIGGVLDFKVTLSSEGPEDGNVTAVPVIFIQEDADIDKIQRYVLRCGPLNYPSIIFWLLSLGSLGGMILSIIVRRKVGGKGPAEEPAAASEPSPETFINFIPLEDIDDPMKDFKRYH